MSEGFGGPLDLSDADTRGFEPIEAGRYPAVVHEIKWDQVKNASGLGSLPAGTPMLRVQFRITQEIDGSTNRRVFTQYYPAPPKKGADGKEYDKGKAQKMKGMFVNFLKALGEDEDKIKTKGYELDIDDLIDRPVAVSVSKEQKRDRNTNDPIEGEYNNPVKGVRPIETLGELTAAEGGLL